MEYQKIANLIDDVPNEPSKFRTKNWVEINNESGGTYHVNRQIKFKTTMLKSSLCDYSDAYILAKGTITITGDTRPEPDANKPRTEAQLLAARQADERDKGVAFKNCAPFINCISEISNTQVDNAKDIDIVMPMYNLIEYSDNYLKTSGSLWKYYRDEPGDDDLEDSESFKSKVKITGNTPANGNTKNVETMVPLNYLSNFWRTPQMTLIKCEVNLILTWSSTCVITNSTGAGTFTISGTKLYVPVVTLSTQDNAKLLEQLKSGFKNVITWNKYLSKLELLAQNQNLNHVAEPSFQGVNRLLVLAFENDTQGISHSGYYLPNVELKDDNIMIESKR